MERSMNPPSEQARESILSNATTHANNSLWNYVSILSWLRALRAAKLVMIVIPAIFGGLASWYSIHSPQNASLVAAFAALAGFFPIVYVAVGLDQSIGYYSALAGKYRLLQALFHNLSTTAGRYSNDALVAEYDRIFAEYCRVREEAHTIPRRYFVLAKKVIEHGDYALLGGSLRTNDVEAVSQDAQVKKPAQPDRQ